MPVRCEKSSTCEQEVLKLIAEAHTNKQIAEILQPPGACRAPRRAPRRRLP
jgi:FixJ family two-component response regulator